MSPYGKVYARGTVTSEKDYTRVEGTGEARSDERDIARELAAGLPNSVNRAMELAYDYHKRSERR